MTLHMAYPIPSAAQCSFHHRKLHFRMPAFGGSRREQFGVADYERAGNSWAKGCAGCRKAKAMLTAANGAAPGAAVPCESFRMHERRTMKTLASRPPAPRSALRSRRALFCAAATAPWCRADGGCNSLWLSRELERLRSVQKPSGEDGLVLTRGHWSCVLQEEDHYQLRGQMEFHNITKRFEIFVLEVLGKLRLLASGSVEEISTAVQILPRHPDGRSTARKDGYWQAYIIRAGAKTSIEVLVDVVSRAGNSLTQLQAARLEIEYVSYGPYGRKTYAQHVILPLQRPDGCTDNPRWRNIRASSGSSLLPIRTHLLSHLDDPLEVLRQYVLPHATANDVIAIGETPLAIMQGRFRHPKNIRPGLTAGLACRLFHPTSSLATACGMQALIDISGRLRVIVAVVIAILGRILGRRGVFYQVAGEQARLIDDATGTLPPYDQFITLGPVRVQATVDALRAKTGCEVAVVDVNDLGSVQILAETCGRLALLMQASHGVDRELLEGALLNNPAGNADEQTPIVLIRK